MSGRTTRTLAAACAILAVVILVARFETGDAPRSSFDRLRGALGAIGIALEPTDAWHATAIASPVLSTGSIAVAIAGRIVATGRDARLSRPFLQPFGPSRLVVGSVAGELPRRRGVGAPARVAAGPLAMSWSATRLSVEADGVAVGGMAIAGASRLDLRCVATGRGVQAVRRAGSAGGHGALRADAGGGLAWAVGLDGGARPLAAHGTLAPNGTVGSAVGWRGTVTFEPGWSAALDWLVRADLVTGGERVAVGGLLAFLAGPTGTVTLPLRLDDAGLSVGSYRIAALSAPPPGRGDGPLSTCWR